ncbi:unnamed protein product [Lepeophtheirus salmonis]|uniref:(salmon louse) hypothetical protein n=1 Tax=Lepeophtheirus salmonis TaxID=72036 RepID=A0A817FCU6_LEPSM|nr:unnamed protein product [Lepeophtheirus salmonis]CAG9477007.1 unnamed protein product [Lepeophtheirus salmonis]
MHIHCGEFKVAWKLNENYIECKGIARQRVRLSCQIFSETTTKAFTFIFGEENEKDKMAERTLLLFNGWFDVMNSQIPVVSENPLKEFAPPRHQSNAKQQLHQPTPPGIKRSSSEGLSSTTTATNQLVENFDQDVLDWIDNSSHSSSGKWNYDY